MWWNGWVRLQYMLCRFAGGGAKKIQVCAKFNDLMKKRKDWTPPSSSSPPLAMIPLGLLDPFISLGSPIRLPHLFGFFLPPWLAQTSASPPEIAPSAPPNIAGCLGPSSSFRNYIGCLFSCIRCWAAILSSNYYYYHYYFYYFLTYCLTSIYTLFSYDRPLIIEY